MEGALPDLDESANAGGGEGGLERAESGAEEKEVVDPGDTTVGGGAKGGPPLG